MGAGLVKKDSEGNFSLTTFGNTIIAQLSALNFLSENRDYFSEHTLGDLPLKFIQRIGALTESELLDNNPVALFEYQKELFNQTEVYLFMILPQLPSYLIDLASNIIKRGIKQLNYIVPYNAILPKKRHDPTVHKQFYDLLNAGTIRRRMVDSVRIGLIMNEKYAMIMFPTAKSTKGTTVEKTDINSAFYSTDSIFHEWCFDYFNYRKVPIIIIIGKFKGF